nr:16S rRNA (adenine(1518)-N(6)/adenine(1519)-N(6))-dimethyltransferase [bacterium]
YDNVEIVSTDALKYPYETLGDSFRVVANIPYYITTPIIFNLLEYRASLKSMTLLMQKEVGRRIVAVPPGREYGVLSISTQLYTRPELKFTVSRKAFSPPPAVDSAVVHFDVSPVPLYDVGDAQLFRSIVKACFSQRRKTILNGLKAFAGIREALDAAGIDPVVRPETLSIDKFADLARCLRK